MGLCRGARHHCFRGVYYVTKVLDFEKEVELAKERVMVKGKGGRRDGFGRINDEDDGDGEDGRGGKGYETNVDDDDDF